MQSKIQIEEGYSSFEEVEGEDDQEEVEELTFNLSTKMDFLQPQNADEQSFSILGESTDEKPSERTNKAAKQKCNIQQQVMASKGLNPKAEAKLNIWKSYTKYH